MQYALLFYNAPEASVEAMPATQREAWFAEMRGWRDDLQQAGVYRTGMRLAGVDTATSVRGRVRWIVTTRSSCDSSITRTPARSRNGRRWWSSSWIGSVEM